MNLEWTEIIITIIGLVFTVIVAPAVAFYFKSRAKTEIAQTVISDVELAVINAVNKVTKTYTADLKARAVNGKLTPEQQGEALHSAIETASDLLSSATKNYLASNGLEVGAYLETLIEAQLQRLE